MIKHLQTAWDVQENLGLQMECWSQQVLGWGFLRARTSRGGRKASKRQTKEIKQSCERITEMANSLFLILRLATNASESFPVWFFLQKLEMLAVSNPRRNQAVRLQIHLHSTPHLEEIERQNYELSKRSRVKVYFPKRGKWCFQRQLQSKSVPAGALLWRRPASSPTTNQLSWRKSGKAAKPWLNKTSHLGGCSTRSRTST